MISGANQRTRGKDRQSMNDEEFELFRQAMADAKPIKVKQRVTLKKRKPKPAARFTRADEADALSATLEVDIDDIEASGGEALRYHRPVVGRRTMRKLARGRYAVQAEIDLHGMSVAEPKVRLEDFIEAAAREGKTCVRVVHGKGRGSGPRGAVLKAGVNRWLRRLYAVLAFTSTRQVDGGTGAVYVLLRIR
jgi:DNA-nicking Smr family endonuclease